MSERLGRRLAELKAEYAAGEKMLAELKSNQADLEKTLLRISGAIQVLEELDGESGAYAGLTKEIVLPPGFVMPSQLSHGDIHASALDRDDLEDDVEGINSSLEVIRRTRGGGAGWPSEPVTTEGNYQDLVWHEVEFRDGGSFAYVVRDGDGGYLGCVYLYRMGQRVELTEELLHHDVDVSWWVTAEAYAQGYYEKLHRALRHWLDEELPFARPYFSNAEIPSD